MRYKLYYYKKAGGKQKSEDLESAYESRLMETVNTILDEKCNDPERLFQLYDSEGHLILSDEDFN